MFLKVMLCVVSFLTTSAHPLHRNIREAPGADSRANQAHNKIELSKNIEYSTSYKSLIDSSNLYNQEDDANKNPVAAEIQHKLNMESERLRIRLHQELTELREKLSPSPSHMSSALASMRERLAPLTQQLQSSLSSNTQDLCVQVSLYLQNMETAESQAKDTQALYQQAFQWMSQTLDRSSLKMTDIIGDFHSRAGAITEGFKDKSMNEGEPAMLEVWQKVSSRLTQEVSALNIEAQNSVGILIEELAALQTTTQTYGAKVAARMEQFCQNAALQNQLFQARMERLFMELEEAPVAVGESDVSSSSSSSQHSGSLQEDFPLKLSALIQDILHSVQ